MEPSVIPRAQIWMGADVIEVRDLMIGHDSLRASAPGRTSARIAVERSAADSVRVQRFDALKTVLTAAGIGAAAATLIGLSVQYGF